MKLISSLDLHTLPEIVFWLLKIVRNAQIHWYNHNIYI